MRVGNADNIATQPRVLMSLLQLVGVAAASGPVGDGAVYPIGRIRSNGAPATGSLHVDRFPLRCTVGLRSVLPVQTKMPRAVEFSAN